MLKKTVIAINAGRKTHNTAIMLQRALEGAKEKGANTEIIHLHDLSYSGCKGCMSCKKLANVPPKRCFINDDLAPVIEKCLKADGIIVGGPVYMWQAAGNFRSFSERFLYPYFIYGEQQKNYYPNRNQKCGIIYTMGAPIDMYKDFKPALDMWSNFYKIIDKDCQTLNVFRTYHVKKFEGYQLDCLNEPLRKTYHDETWEKDLESAYKLGKRLAE